MKPFGERRQISLVQCAKLRTLATVQMFILPLLSVQTLYDGDSVYKRRLRALKAFRVSEVNSMSSLAHTWYTNTHPHMHKAERGR